MTNNSDNEDKFKKTSTQIEAIKRIIASKALNFCLYGGSRSGKSFIIMFIIIVRACKARSDHLIVRETFSAAKKSIWNKTLPDVLRIAFPNLSYKMNKSEYMCILPNGSTISVAGLDDDKKLERLLGTEFSTLWGNETNQIPYTGISKLKTRLAQKNNLKKMCFYDLNPTKTTSWVYQVFEQKVDPNDGEALSDPNDYESFQMNVFENLHNLDEDYLRMLEKLPKKEKLRFLKGEYDKNNTGAAVYAFNRDEHISDDATRIRGATDFVGSDFNFQWNSDVLVSPHGNGIFVWDEIQIEGDTYKKCSKLIKKGVTGAKVVADSTAKARRTSGKSDLVIMTEAGFQIEPFRNPYVKDKIANLNRCFTMGLIKINPRCKKLIRDLQQTTWDKHGQLDQKTDPSLSHLVDSLAYLCFYLFPLVIEDKLIIKSS